MPYTEVQQLLNVNELGDGEIEALIEHAEAAPSDHSTIDIWFQGGAMGCVSAEESAFGDRSAPTLLGIEANWEENPEVDEANIAWASA
jgi:hypothetical protein